MARDPDLVLRNAYLQGRDDCVDIAVGDGRISHIEAEIDERGDEEIDAEGNLTTPGLVDAHVHMDQALSASGERLPKYNDGPFEKEHAIQMSAEHFRDRSADEIQRVVEEVARMAAANGTIHVRTHGYVTEQVGTKSIEALVAAREALADLLDLQVVAFPQDGSLRSNDVDQVAAALDAGADLVGGMDPASVNADVEGTIETWFDLAEDHDADLDVHLHDPGTLGTYTLDRLAAHTIDRGYEDRVNASHSFALADAATAETDVSRFPGGDLNGLIERLSRAGLSVATCYLSTRPGMPIRRLQDAGVPVAHGADNVRDHWAPHGNLDPVEAMLIQSLKHDTSYTYSRNDSLDHLWRMITTDAARVMGIADGYGIEPGTSADLVLHDALSRQWAIISPTPRRVVIKDGSVVARDGELVR